MGCLSAVIANDLQASSGSRILRLAENISYYIIPTDLTSTTAKLEVLKLKTIASQSNAV